MDWPDEVGIPDVECLTETDKAILVRYETQQYWIPKSQISDNSEVWEAGQLGELVISRFISQKVGLG